MVLAVIGWILLGLLALLVLLMVVPITIRVRFANGDFGVWVRVLFVRLRVFPLQLKERKPKKPKPPKEPPKEEAEAEPKKKKPPKTMGEKVALIKRLAKAGGAAMGVFFRHLRVAGVQLVLPIHAEDAADTATRCGQVQAAIGTVRAVADGRFHLKFRRIQILPDFAGQNADALFLACNIRFCPGIIFKMGAVFLWRFWRSRRPYTKAAYKTALAEKQQSRAA